MHEVYQDRCCRNDWIVGLTAEECTSGLFQFQVICSLTNKECERSEQACRYRPYRFGKRLDKRFVYLENNLCNTYDMRPQICRDFQFKAGMGGID